MRMQIGRREIDVNISEEKANWEIEKLTRAGFTKEKNYRRMINAIKKAEAEEMEQRNQKPISDMTITIQWKKSRTWGYVPKAVANIYYEDGSFLNTDTYTVSGYGYCKESAVIAEFFNDFLKYKLWDLEGNVPENVPYGLRLNYKYNPYFDSGIGVSSLENIIKFLGGKMEKVASAERLDVYRISF